MKEKCGELRNAHKLELVAKINGMSHVGMARLWRFAPPGHPFFDRKRPYYEIFKKRFEELGGMTPEISKEIGWREGQNETTAYKVPTKDV